MAFAALLAAADRAAFQSFGDSITYTPSPLNGDPVTVSGIFDSPYRAASADGQSLIASGPQVFLRLTDLPTDPEGEDTPTITTADGTNYTVRDVRKDGQGGVMLMLREVTT